MNPTHKQSGVICDTHPMWLEAVEQVLRQIDVDVVGKTTTTSEALSLVEKHQPDLLITELESAAGDLSGLALIERARAAAPAVRPIALSLHADAQVIDSALSAGAVAYVVKTAHPEDLASAVPCRRSRTRSTSQDVVRWLLHRQRMEARSTSTLT